MAERIQFPQWRAEHEPTRYPFASEATLTNGEQFLPAGTLLDACLYPIGGGADLYLSAVVVDHDRVTVFFGDAADARLCSGSFDLVSPPDTVPLVDAFGRSAGLLVSESSRLGLFGAWGLGTFAFEAEQTPLAATVCFPQPAVGVRGIRVPDGTVLTGDVWFVGEDGVVLRKETVEVPPERCGPARAYTVIRVDVVGDPLFRRRLCTPTDLFETPRYVQSIVFSDGRQVVECGPGPYGDVKVTVNNDLAADTVLRVHPTEAGTKIGVVGSLMKSVR